MVGIPSRNDSAEFIEILRSAQDDSNPREKTQRGTEEVILKEPGQRNAHVPGAPTLRDGRD